MKELIRYAFAVNIGWPYLMMLPVILLSPTPWPVNIAIYAAMSLPFLGIAALLRRRERKGGRVRPSVLETMARALAHVPTTVGTTRRPSLLGLVAQGPMRSCHFLAAKMESGEVRVLIVSSRWPYRTRELKSFRIEREWREWARSVDARLLPEGRYADAVYEQYFAESVAALHAS